MNKFIALLMVLVATTGATLSPSRTIAADTRIDSAEKEACIKACKKCHDACEAVAH